MKIVQKTMTDGKKKIRVVTLPEDIVHFDILPRLPFKSALQCKSVSKSWKAVISDDHFAELHWQAQNPMDNDYLIVKKDLAFSVLRPYEEITISYHPNDYPCELIGSARGLVCIRRGEKFFMWNPALQRSKEFEFCFPPNLCDSLSNSGLTLDDLTHSGLCFDPHKTDFKVVVCFVRNETNITYGTIYSYKDQTWKQISVVPHDLFRLDLFDGESLYATSTCPYVMIDDCPCWKTRPSSDSLEFAAVKFEATIDAFKSFPTFYPDPEDDHAQILYQFVNMNNSLALFASNHDMIVVDIYCLDKEDESGTWTMKCRITLPDIINQPWHPSHGFQYSDELLFVESGAFSYYDENSESTRYLVGTWRSKGLTKDALLICYAYKPTLRLLPGMNTKTKSSSKLKGR